MAPNPPDPLLSRLEHQSRAQTLIARREGGKLIFDIRLQGENETVFLDI
jgi:protocatechuate 3,4-dioxygenase, alpha subunit